MNYFRHEHNTLLTLEMFLERKLLSGYFLFNFWLCAMIHQYKETRYAFHNSDDDIAFWECPRGTGARWQIRQTFLGKVWWWNLGCIWNSECLERKPWESGDVTSTMQIICGWGQQTDRGEGSVLRTAPAEGTFPCIVVGVKDRCIHLTPDIQMLT